jgi:hypothetical protein
MRVEITEKNIRWTANKLSYLSVREVAQELLAEGAQPDVTFFLIIAAENFLDNRESDFKRADEAFASED